MSAAETESGGESSASRPAGRWKRRLAWGVGGLVGLVGLAGVGGWAFVNSASGSGWLVQRGLAAYDGGVEGSVKYAGSEGSFEDGITLKDFELRDRDGRLLLAAERVGWAISPWRAMRGDVQLHDFVIESGTLVLPADGEPGFEDLRRPPRDDEADEERDEDGGGPGGTLAVSMHVGGFELRQRSEPDQALESTELLAELRRFDLDARSEGDTARLDMGLSFAVPALEGLDVEKIQLALVYERPLAKVESFAFESSWGSMTLAGLVVDREHGWAELEKSELSVPAVVLSRELGLELPEPPTVAASGRLAMDGSDFSVDVDLGSGGTARLNLKSTPFPKLSLSASLEGAIALDRLRPERGFGKAEFSAELGAAPRDGGAWGVGLKLRCAGCEGGAPGEIDPTAAPAPGLALDLEMGPAGPADAGSGADTEAATRGPGAWSGQLFGHAAGLRFGGELWVRPGAEVEAESEAEGARSGLRWGFLMELETRELERLAAVLDRWGLRSADARPWQGAVAVGLRCEGGAALATLRCAQASRRLDGPAGDTPPVELEGGAELEMDAPLPEEGAARLGLAETWAALLPVLEGGDAPDVEGATAPDSRDN